MSCLAHLDPVGHREQSILEHLTGTAAMSASFSRAFSAENLGYLCGILHDIGKYSEKFQLRIKGSNVSVDHSTAGAQVAFFELKNVPAAFCIAGHHSGLPDLGNRKFDTADSPTFFGKMARKVGSDIEEYGEYRSEVRYADAPTPPWLPVDAQSQFFFVRMLYSCLVDADFLDTEAFMRNGTILRGNKSTMEDLCKLLDTYTAGWWDAKTPLNHKRCAILKTLLEAGEQDKGLFSLTVPTGGGKTVSSMGFALRHAVKNRLRRVIYIIPYTSIIEQTQQVFETIFGEENVVAHYSGVEYNTDENGIIADKRYLSAENWDAPIIITTAVQFFESLYANRSSRCRKLHNIANSVLIFDEAQMLPVPCLEPCVSAIAQLVKNYDCTAVLCTATQPALNPLFQKHLGDIPIVELCPDAAEMHDFFRRVRYEKLGVLSNEALAQRLNSEPQVLCVVNSRKQAQSIYKQLDSNASFHLSTTLYPAHRRRVLDEIRSRLTQNLPCRVVSTSLIEAGVDVDFPTVYRSLSGLDSMIQAGGRCNRESKRAVSQSTVYIFEEEKGPPEMLLQNISAAQRAMRNHEDLSSPQAVEEYFRFLYYTLKDEKELDKKQILQEIESGALPFASVAERFRMIDNAGSTIYIPLGEGKALAQQLREQGPNRSLMRKLGQYAVNAYPQHYNQLLQGGAIEIIGPDAAILNDVSIYSEKTGLAFFANEGQAYLV